MLKNMVTGYDIEIIDILISELDLLPLIIRFLNIDPAMN
jgi:hypothetical protein